MDSYNQKTITLFSVVIIFFCSHDLQSAAALPEVNVCNINLKHLPVEDTIKLVQRGTYHDLTCGYIINTEVLYPGVKLQSQQTELFIRDLSAIKSWLNVLPRSKLDEIAKIHIQRILAQKAGRMRDTTGFMKQIIGMVPQNLKNDGCSDNPFFILDNIIIDFYSQTLKKIGQDKNVLIVSSLIGLMRKYESKGKVGSALAIKKQLVNMAFEAFNEGIKSEGISYLNTLTAHAEKDVLSPEISKKRLKNAILRLENTTPLKLENTAPKPQKKSLSSMPEEERCQTVLCAAQPAPEISKRKQEMQEEAKKTLEGIRTKLNNAGSLTRADLAFIRQHKPTLTAFETEQYRIAKNQMPSKGRQSLATPPSAIATPAPVIPIAPLAPPLNNTPISHFAQIKLHPKYHPRLKESDLPPEETRLPSDIFFIKEINAKVNIMPSPEKFKPLESSDDIKSPKKKKTKQKGLRLAPKPKHFDPFYPFAKHPLSHLAYSIEERQFDDCKQ